MIMVKFRSNEEHKDLLHKVKKMKEYAEMIEECLEEAMDDDEEYSYRGGSNYRREMDEEDMHMRGGRYSYRRGGMR